MGPANMKWYQDRGLTHEVSEVLDEDQRFGNLKAGDTWTYEEITTYYCCGRIDIRGLDHTKYWNGWDEYSLSPMHGEDWSALSGWLDNLETEECLSYDELIETFEKHYGREIRWMK
jgi:hypothetical protein